MSGSRLLPVEVEGEEPITLGAGMSEKDIKRLFKAAKEGEFGLLEMAQRAGVVLKDLRNEKKQTLLHVAVLEEDQPDLIRYLLETAQLDVNALSSTGATALSIAEGVGHQKSVALLKADIEKQKRLAEEKRKLEEERRAKLEAEARAVERKALFKAAEEGNVQRLKESKDKNQLASLRNDKGLGLLHLAVKEDHLEVARYLLEVKCEVTMATQHGATPLSMAKGLGYPDMVLLLESHMPKPKALEIKVDPTELKTFLKCVVEGEQDQAEAMLKKDKNLALVAGSVKDLSEREFKHITGFQYAVWALDWHMWTMLEKYIPKEEQAKQIKELEDKGTEHGKQVSWDKLIDALTKYIEECDKVNKGQKERDSELMARLWQKEVGGAQRLLPVHVVNEYCRPDRSMYPCPSFEEKTLPRSRQTAVGDWFTGQYNGGALGVKFACYRGDAPTAAAHAVVRMRNDGARAGAGARANYIIYRLRVDMILVGKALRKTRTQQADQLKTKLLQALRPSPSPMK